VRTRLDGAGAKRVDGQLTSLSSCGVDFGPHLALGDPAPGLAALPRGGATAAFSGMALAIAEASHFAEASGVSSGAVGAGGCQSDACARG
jgi:hypothetical protein